MSLEGAEKIFYELFAKFWCIFILSLSHVNGEIFTHLNGENLYLSLSKFSK